MKAVLASALTALVLVAGAWASNVTPHQLSALSRRVDQLQARVAALQTKQAGDEKRLAKYTSYNDRCLNSFKAVTVYGIQTTNPDGSVANHGYLAATEPSAQANFWIPAVPDVSPCVAATTHS